MPIYEYKCTQCGRDEEVLQSIYADPPCCDPCKTMMTRQVSRTSFSLKGSNWYRDHYGLKPQKESEK